MTDARCTAATYRFERWRALAAGILEAAGGTFLLLIAVRWFDGSCMARAVRAARFPRFTRPTITVEYPFQLH